MTTYIEARDRMQLRLLWRASDTPPTMGRRFACRRVRGFTLLELLAAMMLFAIMVGSALAAFPRRPYAVWTAQATVVAELRRTRNDALTKGDHFRMVVSDPTTWATYRLQLVGGVWTPVGGPIRSGTLPSGIVFTAGAGKQFEFTTRGLMVTPDAATTLVIEDVSTAAHRGVTIYPSGQVAPA